MVWAARRRYEPVLSLAGLLALAVTVSAASLDQPFQHVQASDEHAYSLLIDGYERSSVFRQIVTHLEDSDWTVFIQLGRCPEVKMFGCLLHRIGDFHGHRYLQIILNGRSCSDDCLISILAHELKHACEVASAPEVVADEVSLNKFFARLSAGRWRQDRLTGGQVVEVYETAGALEAEREVLRELRQNKTHR